MGRVKDRKRIIYQPSTQEILSCLRGMPSYSKIILGQYPDKPYSAFLSWLIDKNFYKGIGEHITIKKISADFGTEAIKATKWIKEIYDQIFDLNIDKPELFQTNGIKVCMDMKNYDNFQSFYTSLPVLPRVHETIRFPFAHGKVGIDYFWVKKVEHEIADDTVLVTVGLEGGFLNKYREFAIDKALFQGWIHYMDVYELLPFQLDEEIKRIYRN